MNTRGDLRRKESYESAANLTEEQKDWSRCWSFMRRLQSKRDRLQYGLVSIIPRNRRDSRRRFMSHQDIVAVSLLPMASTMSGRFSRESHPVRLHVQVQRFGRDSTGRPMLGGEPSRVINEVDGSKAPMQDQPVVQVVDFDPCRNGGSSKDSIGAAIQSAGSIDMLSRVSGVVSLREVVGCLVVLVDGLPLYRFPLENKDQIQVLVEEGQQVSADDKLVRLTGEPFHYNTTEFVDERPDVDEYRVLSPLSGSYMIDTDDLYHNVVIVSGARR